MGALIQILAQSARCFARASASWLRVGSSGIAVDHFLTKADAADAGPSRDLETQSFQSASLVAATCLAKSEQIESAMSWILSTRSGWCMAALTAARNVFHLILRAPGHCGNALGHGSARSLRALV